MKLKFDLKRGFFCALMLLLCVSTLFSCTFTKTNLPDPNSSELTKGDTDTVKEEITTNKPSNNEAPNDNNNNDNNNNDSNNNDSNDDGNDDGNNNQPAEPTVTKIACVGDSLTFGGGLTNPTTYPSVLQNLLGTGSYLVKNFGSEGRAMTPGLTSSNIPDRSYIDTEIYQESLAFNPDIVILCLGTNDTWLVNLSSQTAKDNFVKGLTALVNSYKELGVDKIYVCLPPYAVKNNIGTMVKNLVIPLIQANAETLDYEIIDFYTPTEGKDDWLKDQLHFNPIGYEEMAKTAYLALTNQSTMPTVTKIACAGDSLTFGNGHTNRAYPIVLQELLGSLYTVKNFGAGGRTATEGLSDSVRPDRSYNATQEYRNSLAMQADIVIICLGTNDMVVADLVSEQGRQKYVTGMKNLIAAYREAGAKTVYIGLPPYALATSYNQIGERLLPLVQQVAEECNVETIDFYTPTYQDNSLIDKDKLHLTAKGYETMANAVYQTIVTADDSTDQPTTPDDNDQPTESNVIKIACVGDSLTFGGGVSLEAEFYPSVLQSLLGDQYEVKGFGTGGSTMSPVEGRSFIATQSYLDSIGFAPDIVVISLGTCDTYGADVTTEEGKSTFVAGMTALVNAYRNAGADEVYLCLPPYGVKNDIGEKVRKYILPLIRENAASLNCEIIDFFTPTDGRTDYLANDQLHCNAEGYKVMANAVYEKLTKNNA